MSDHQLGDQHLHRFDLGRMLVQNPRRELVDNCWMPCLVFEDCVVESRIFCLEKRTKDDDEKRGVEELSKELI